MLQARITKGWRGGVGHMAQVAPKDTASPDAKHQRQGHLRLLGPSKFVPKTLYDFGGRTAGTRYGCLRRMCRLRSPRCTKSLLHAGQGSAVPRCSFWCRRKESRHRNVLPHSPQASLPALRWSRLALEAATATAAGEEFVSEGVPASLSHWVGDWGCVQQQQQ